MNAQSLLRWQQLYHVARNAQLVCYYVSLIRLHHTIHLPDFIVEFDELAIGGIIGRGSFSVVHRGQWQGRDVALKRIRAPPGAEDVVSSQEVTVLRLGSKLIQGHCNYQSK